MKTNKSKLQRKCFWQIRKYHRWLRIYLKRVRATEVEIGGELQAC